MADQNLRQALRTFLAEWKNDLSPAWRQAIGEASPDFDAVRDDLLLRETETIFPGRRARPPVVGAPAGAHVFRALDNLAPQNVKAVILGQDPYPQIARATGRAFEQGNLSSWSEPGKEVASSLKAVVQALAFHRTSDPLFLQVAGGWDHVVRSLTSGSLQLEAPRALFDRWEAKGVLCINAAFTISRYVRGGGPEQEFGHLPLWRPVVIQILRFLAQRPNRSVVFLTWGSFARSVIQEAGLEQLPEWGRSASAAHKRHPSTPEFLEPPDPFARANELLTQMGSSRIDW